MNRRMLIFAVVTMSAALRPAASQTPAPNKALPDVVGIYPGMPLREAYSRVQAEYPKARIDHYPIDMPGVAKKVLAVFKVNGQAGVNGYIYVNVTLPPEQQVVWKVTRRLDGNRMNRATLLASLREKYGRETSAFGGNQGQARDDRQISRLTWVRDDQGRPVSAAPPEDYSCDNVGETHNFFMLEIGGNHFPTGPCVARIRTTALFTGDADIITNLDIEMTDMPRALRTARATTAWWKAAEDKARKQDIEQTKKDRPKL